MAKERNAVDPEYEDVVEREPDLRPVAAQVGRWTEASSARGSSGKERPVYRAAIWIGPAAILIACHLSCARNVQPDRDDRNRHDDGRSGRKPKHDAVPSIKDGLDNIGSSRGRDATVAEHRHARAPGTQIGEARPVGHQVGQ